MFIPAPGRPTGQKGMALLVTLIFVALFACLALAIAASADTNITIARNRVEAHQASCLAEAGLRLAQRHLGGMGLDAQYVTDDAADLRAAIATHLSDVFEQSGMVAADEMDDTGSDVTFTAVVQGPDGRTGTVDVAISTDGGALGGPTVSVQSTGRFGHARRTVSYQMTVQGGAYTFGAYGIASRSPIQMTGNASISGADDDSEASILSATYSQDDAVRLTGNVNVAGDVAIVNPDGEIAKTGNVTIGGNEVVGASEPVWPEVDASVFEPYVQTALSCSTSGNRTFTNIRIPAGSNPTFSGNITLYGVIYVESPNDVKFSGNTTVTGVIVCETPEVDDLSANKIQFTGNMSTSGVESLPDQPEFDGLRDLAGSFLLAQGYSAKFTGNFGTVNGCIVASELQLTGNAGGTIRGGVLNLADTQLKMTGNAHLTIDKDPAYNQAAGLRQPYRLVCRAGTYEE